MSRHNGTTSAAPLSQPQPQSEMSQASIIIGLLHVAVECERPLLRATALTVQPSICIAAQWSVRRAVHVVHRHEQSAVR